MEKTTFAIKISEDVIGNFKIFCKEHRIIDSLIKINEAAKLEIYFQLEGHKHRYLKPDGSQYGKKQWNQHCIIIILVVI